MDDRTRRLKDEPVGKLLLRFSLPAIAGMLVSSLYVVIDRAFLGNVVGPDAIAGLAICTPIAFIIMAVGLLIGVGSGALVSIRLGQQKRDEAEEILGNAFTLIVIASIVLSAVFLVTLEPLLRGFGATEHTLPYALQFMRVILIGSFFQYTGFGLNAIIRSEGNARLAMFTMLINAGINIALDVLFIFGFGWGVTGAAVATVIAQGVGAVWTLAHFRSSRSVLKLRAANLRLRGSVVRGVLAIGMAPCAMHLAASVTNLFINRGLSAHGGDAAISAYGVIGAVGMIFLMPVLGIVQGAQPIIGFNYGARQFDRVRRALKLAIISSTMVSLVGWVVVQGTPHLLIATFARDAELIEVGSRGMRICLLVMPVVGFQVVGAHFFQAIGKAKISLVLTLLRQLIVLLPLLLILPHFMGLDGVWVAGPIADTVATLLTFVALNGQLRELGSGTGAGPSAPAEKPAEAA